MTHESLEASVLVIGSGAAGAVTAATLAEAGHEVLMVEEGLHTPPDSLSTNSPEAMKLLYRNRGLTPIYGRVNIAFVEGCCLGGSTEINSAFWRRPPPEAVRRWQEKYQVRDLDFDQLLALIVECENRLGVRSMRSAELPASSARFRDGLEKIGWTTEEVPRAQGSDLSASQFAPSAKRSMSRTYIPAAHAAGARSLVGCRVDRLLIKGGRVIGATGRLTTDVGKRPITIRSQHVFVAGGAIQSAALLRRSGVRRHIGNSLHIHPMLKMAALFDETMDSHLAPLPIYQAKNNDGIVTLGGSVFTPGFLALALSDNWKENEAVMGEWRRMALYYASCRGTNCGTVRVTPLTGEPIVRYEISDEDHLNLCAGIAGLGEALLLGGAKKLYPGVRGLPVLDSIDRCRSLIRQPVRADAMSLSTVHVLSSCPMGENAELCAVDSYGKCHGFENLYLSDASIIPDSPGVNPQCTVMALALRNARRFAERSGKK